MTKLEMFNRVFQFSLFRLTRIFEDGKQTGWGLLGPVLPFTGWSSPYIGTPKIVFRWKGTCK